MLNSQLQRERLPAGDNALEDICLVGRISGPDWFMSTKNRQSGEEPTVISGVLDHDGICP
jgi:hypothetical protein